MDAKDITLLEMLLEDASRPLKTLAAAVGLSRSSVRDRIARMRAEGTIRRYTVELAPAKGDIRTILLVRLAQTPNPEIVRAISMRSDVERCYSLSGPIDLLVELVGNNVEKLNEVRDEIAVMSGVAGVETFLVLKPDKLARKN